MSDQIEEYVAKVMDELAYSSEPKSSGAPRYSPDGMKIQYLTACLDCGSVVFDKRAHDRFHGILNDHAKALAVLQTVHVSERLHDKFDVTDRINKRRHADEKSEVTK